MRYAISDISKTALLANLDQIDARVERSCSRISEEKADLEKIQSEIKQLREDIANAISPSFDQNSSNIKSKESVVPNTNTQERVERTTVLTPSQPTFSSSLSPIQKQENASPSSSTLSTQKEESEKAVSTIEKREENPMTEEQTSVQPIKEEESVKPIETEVETVKTVHSMQSTQHREQDAEKFIGKKVMGILASIMIIMGVGLCGVVVFPLIQNGIKFALMCLMSIVFMVVGMHLRSKSENAFNLSLIGCGSGALYISLIVGNMYFNILSPILLFLCLALWSVVNLWLTKKYNSMILRIIGYIGIFITVSILSSISDNLISHDIEFKASEDTIFDDPALFLGTTAFYMMVFSYIYGRGIKKTWFYIVTQSLSMLFTVILMHILIDLDSVYWRHNVFAFESIYFLLIGYWVFIIINTFRKIQKREINIRSVIFLYIASIIFIIEQYYDFDFGFVVNTHPLISTFTFLFVFILSLIIRKSEKEWENTFVNVLNLLALPVIVIMSYAVVQNLDMSVKVALGTYISVLDLVQFYWLIIPLCFMTTKYERAKKLVSKIQYLIPVMSGLYLVYYTVEFKIAGNPYYSTDSLMSLPYLSSTLLFIGYLFCYNVVLREQTEGGKRVIKDIVVYISCLININLIASVLYYLCIVVTFNIYYLDYYVVALPLFTVFHLIMRKRIKQTEIGATFYMAVVIINALLGLMLISMSTEEGIYNIIQLCIYAIVTTLSINIVREEIAIKSKKWGTIVMLFGYSWLILALSIKTDNSYIVSVSLLVWAVFCILFGFKREIKSARMYGLVLSLISTFKIVLFDTSYTTTIGRAVSSLICGVLLFIISFIYNKIEQRAKITQ